MKNIKILFIIIGLGLLALSLTGCNTMAGFGQDIQEMGEGVSGVFQR